MTTITEAQKVALVKAVKALWDRWDDESYYIIKDLVDNATIDTNSLWRDRPREDWMRDDTILLELVDAPYISVELTRGLSVLIDDDSEAVAVLPEDLPALIAMLTEVQRRIGGEAAQETAPNKESAAPRNDPGTAESERKS